MKVLITGGCGFLGTNLAIEALSRKWDLTIFDNLSRHGAEQNLSWLQSKGQFGMIKADIRSAGEVEKTIRDLKPDLIFHLAGQVAMTTSIENPRADFEINAGGTLNVLDAVRCHSQNSALVYSSTNKVFGDLAWAKLEEKPLRYICPDYPNGFNEQTPLEFHSPYGCSKGTADQYVLDYARIFGLKTIVFRHSSIFGLRQFSTFDQGWIGWFISQAIAQKSNIKAPEFTISGDGKQVRDVLFSEDLVQCYYSAIESLLNSATAKWGQAYNIGGGAANSLSLLELFKFLEEELACKLRYKKLPWRESDQKVFIADLSKAKQDFGWAPKASSTQGLKKMCEWVGENG